MYNDPSAKDLLAQYPRQYAEGGEIGTQVIVYGPDGKMYRSPEEARAAGVTNYTMAPPQGGSGSTSPFSNQAVVDLYTRNLGRAPDPEGYAYWNEKFGTEVSPEEASTFKQGVASYLGNNADAYRSQYGDEAFNRASQYSGLAPSNTLPVVTPDLNKQAFPGTNTGGQDGRGGRGRDNPRNTNTGGNSTGGNMGWSAPKVTPSRIQLNEFTPGLSASQLYARDRAAQDALLTSAYRNTGAAPLTNMEYRALQQKMRSGELNAENIQEQLINPLYADRVTKAYAAIGRTGPVVPAEQINVPGATVETLRAVDKEGFDYWLNKLKSGEITGQQFQNTFLTSAAATPTGANAKTQLEYTNKARAALGLKPITEQELPGYQAPPATPQPWNAGYNILNNSPQPWQSNILNAVKNPVVAAAPAAPVVSGNVTNPGQTNYTISPVNFSSGAAGNTQLFNEGGDVKKYDEPDKQAPMSEEDRARLAMMIEQQMLQNTRAKLGPMELSAIPSSRREGRYDVRAEADLYGAHPYADYDVKEGRLRELGLKHRGQSDLGDYELQYAMDPETKQVRVVGAIRKQLSPTSSISAHGMYMPNDYKDAYNVGVNYRKEFAEGGDVKK